MELRGKRWTNTLVSEKIAGKRIRSLELFDTAVDDDFLETVAKSGTLQSIHISSQTISDRGIACIVEHNPLTSLMLSGVPKVTDECMDAICACKTIRELYLDGTSVSDDGVESIGELPEGVTMLEGQSPTMLRINNCKIDKTGIKWIVENLPIEFLELASSQMTELEVRQLGIPRKLQVMVHESG